MAVIQPLQRADETGLGKIAHFGES
jgi:hypothetical protein